MLNTAGSSSCLHPLQPPVEANSASCFAFILPFPLPFWPDVCVQQPQSLSSSPSPAQGTSVSHPPWRCLGCSFLIPNLRCKVTFLWSKLVLNYLVLCYMLYSFRVLKPQIFEWWEIVYFNPFQVISLCHCALPGLHPDQSLSTECPLQKHLTWYKVHKCWGESWRPETNSFPLILSMYKTRECFQHLMLE